MLLMSMPKCEVLTRRWKPLFALLTPLLLAPIPAALQIPEARCGYVLLVMAVFWVTEALPLPATALLPIFAFPLLGILPTNDVCMVYFKATNMMYMGGLMIAIAVEHCHLHKRIALAVILRVGQSTRQLMAGFMLVTMFLSMWISNMAATAMVVPILDAVLQELYKFTNEESPTVQEPSKQAEFELRTASVNIGDDTLLVTKPTKGSTCRPPNKKCRQMRDMMFLATAYGANLGGTGTVTGTGPNLVLSGVLTSEYSDPTGLNFASWMGFNVPGMLICVFLAWIWLQMFFLGFRKDKSSESTKEKENAIKKLISNKYNELGPMTFHEGSVLLLFIAPIIRLWNFKITQHIMQCALACRHPDWPTNQYYTQKNSLTMLIMYIIYIILKKYSFIHKKYVRAVSHWGLPDCLTPWSVIQNQFRCGSIVLLGGYTLMPFNMVDAVQVQNCLRLLRIENMPQLYIFNLLLKVAIAFIFCLSIYTLRVASNTATASILMPVLNKLSISLSVNPLYLMLPAAVTCSYAFMLPVATPPNAIVFSAAGDMKTSTMMKVGVGLNIICVIVVTLMINTLGVAMFDLNSLPAWVNSTTTL
ncbi:unnamed protein product, partial [Meganyctiphanes norvegica]